MNTAFSLAFRARAVRERANLPIGELAAKSGISRNTLSHLEHGADTKVSTLIALSSALNVPAHSWLLPDKEWFAWFCEDFIPSKFAGEGTPEKGRGHENTNVA